MKRLMMALIAIALIASCEGSNGEHFLNPSTPIEACIDRAGWWLLAAIVLYRKVGK